LFYTVTIAIIKLLPTSMRTLQTADFICNSYLVNRLAYILPFIVH